MKGVRVTKVEHDNGLFVCQKHRDLFLDEEEFLAVNYLCMAWASDELL